MEVKYPRTYHLPWSEEITDDDKRIGNVEHFEGKEVVVSVKMDGENTTMYGDKIHARSLSSRNHLSRNWVANFHSNIKTGIPDGWRICGENLYAKHSIHYKNLKSYFLGFSIWDNNKCISWNDTLEWFKLLGIESVPVLFDGLFEENKIKDLWKEKYNGDEMEGYVVRLRGTFSYQDFKLSVAKFVRKSHIRTDEHWLHKGVVKNVVERNSM